MSTVRKRDEVVALAVSDVHLSLRPPVARAEEQSWLDAMARPWEEVARLARRHKAPIICAGDLFDRWNPPVELVNWALTHLPQLYAIPGNHDLPGHNLGGIHRTAYWTLVQAGRIVPLTPEGAEIGRATFYGFPFGTRITRPRSDGLNVAVVHEYLWVPGHGYKDAPEECRLGRRARAFSKFNVVVVGDNHRGFVRRLKGGTWVVNCGTFLRRKSDEAHYSPAVAVIHASGCVSQHFLDTSRDAVTELLKDEDGDASSVRDFVRSLESLEADPLDFVEALRQAARKSPKRVQRALMEAVRGPG